MAGPMPSEPAAVLVSPVNLRDVSLLLISVLPIMVVIKVVCDRAEQFRVIGELLGG